ncbi:MAG: alpha/beta fold hydrolase [Solirubrobacterales bacterium]
MSEQFCDVGRGITLCYETFGEPQDPPLLLIMGLATQMLGWDEEFCHELAGHGFYVVRFDNRDIGHSTHLDFRAPRRRQLATRRFSNRQYDLGDMADDANGLLAGLELSPAHVVGASMGGMIAQTLAARHPGSVRSLTSIMSTTGSRVRGQPHPSVYRAFLAPRPSDPQAYLDYATALFAVIGSPPPNQDLDHIRELIKRSMERDSDPWGRGRQLGAILASGNRTRELRKIAAPTLVIHGDSDKLINRSGGRATAEAIRGSKRLTIKGMGHDLPRAFWPRLIGAISEHAQAADERSSTDALPAGSA